MGSESPTSIECELVVPNEEGIHARPAAQFVRCACSFDCEVHILKDGQSYDARSIMSVLAANLNRDDRFVVRAEGPRAAEALQALRELVASFPT